MRQHPVNKSLSRIDLENNEAIWRPDVTVATIVPNAQRFLLIEETVRDQLVLNQPAGHLELGESLQQAACRETLEETGWVVDLLALVGVYQWSNPKSDRHFLRFTFAAKAISHDPTHQLDAGILRALWLTRAEIEAQTPRLRSPFILKSLDDYLVGRLLPLSAVQSLL